MRDGHTELRSEDPIYKNELHEVILVLGHFGPWRSYLKMALKNDFFDFFQTVCFWKAEIELEMDLLEFLGSEVI